MLGWSCRRLDAVGTAAAARLLGGSDPTSIGAGQCAAGEFLELAAVLEPRNEYVVDVVAVAPVQRLHAVLEVHPDVRPSPLVDLQTAAADGEPLVLTFPEKGLLWDGQVATTARLVVTVASGAGVVAARVRALDPG